MGHILKETIGNHSSIIRVLRNGQYVLMFVLGIKMHGILIYRDNSPPINYLFHSHWFELKFMGGGANVLIGVLLSKALKCAEPHKLQMCPSRSSSCSSGQLLRLSSNRTVLP